MVRDSVRQQTSATLKAGTGKTAVYFSPENLINLSHDGLGPLDARRNLYSGDIIDYAPFLLCCAPDPCGVTTASATKPIR